MCGLIVGMGMWGAMPASAQSLPSCREVLADLDRYPASQVADTLKPYAGEAGASLRDCLRAAGAPWVVQRALVAGEALGAPTIVVAVGDPTWPERAGGLIGGQLLQELGVSTAVAMIAEPALDLPPWYWELDDRVLAGLLSAMPPGSTAAEAPSALGEDGEDLLSDDAAVRAAAEQRLYRLGFRTLLVVRRAGSDAAVRVPIARKSLEDGRTQVGIVEIVGLGDDPEGSRGVAPSVPARLAIRRGAWAVVVETPVVMGRAVEVLRDGIPQGRAVPEEGAWRFEAAGTLPQAAQIAVVVRDGGVVTAAVVQAAAEALPWRDLAPVVPRDPLPPARDAARLHVRLGGGFQARAGATLAGVEPAVHVRAVSGLHVTAGLGLSWIARLADSSLPEGISDDSGGGIRALLAPRVGLAWRFRPAAVPWVQPWVGVDGTVVPLGRITRDGAASLAVSGGGAVAAGVDVFPRDGTVGVGFEVAPTLLSGSDGWVWLPGAPSGAVVFVRAALSVSARW